MEIKPEELYIELINIGSSWQPVFAGVKLTHIPTGCTASSQAARSQHQNKQDALEKLKSFIERHYASVERVKALQEDYMNNTNIHRWAKEITALVNGETVQIKRANNGDYWEDLRFDRENFDFRTFNAKTHSFRVKPKTVVRWMNIYLNTDVNEPFDGGYHPSLEDATKWINKDGQRSKFVKTIKIEVEIE